MEINLGSFITGDFSATAPASQAIKRNDGDVAHESWETREHTRPFYQAVARKF